MASQLEVVFGTGGGKEETKVFTQQPLGVDFCSQMPIVIIRIRIDGQAEELGIKLGWKVHSINGTPLAGMNIEKAHAFLVASTAPLRSSMLVRRCPLEAMSTAKLSRQLKNVDAARVVEFLQEFSIVAQSACTWGGKAERPELLLGAINGHREVGKPTHTWYAIVGKVITPGKASSTRHWRVERRLAHIRALLYDPVKQELGHEYAHHFQTARFANRGRLPGTTAKIETWLAALPKVINSGKLSPTLVASILCALEAPLLQEGEEQAIPEGVKDVGGNMKQVHGGVAAVSEICASSVYKKTRYAEATPSGIPAAVASARQERGQIEEATTSGFLAASALIAVDAKTISELLAAVSATEAAESPEQPHALSFWNDADDSADGGAEKGIEGAAADIDGSYGSCEEGPAEAPKNNNKLRIFHV